MLDNYVRDVIDVECGDRTIKVTLLSPEAGKLSDDPALVLSLAMDAETTLFNDDYSIPAQYFLGKGHRAASFDIPNHGSRVNEYGEGIPGFRNAFLHGGNPFAELVQDGVAVIDRFVELGLVSPGRIAVSGTSRGGYMALSLLAADPRISSGAAFAPVTDWQCLHDFREGVDQESLRSLRLSNIVKDLAGKYIYIPIGNHDLRVSTESCCRFFVDLLQANLSAGFDESYVDFYCTDDPGHSVGKTWQLKGAECICQRSTSITR